MDRLVIKFAGDIGLMIAKSCKTRSYMKLMTGCKIAGKYLWINAR